MISKLRRALRPLRLAALCLKGYIQTSKWQQDEDKVCWIIGSPDHKNLGDHAITYATQKFVCSVLPEYKIIEITETNFYSRFAEMKRNLKPNHIIVLQGGGNFGNEYQYTEDIRRVVVFSCKKNPIVMFPQTMFFANDAAGDKEKKHTQTLYNKNRQMRYFAREKYTAKAMAEMFGEDKVRCVPDIVLSLYQSNIMERYEKNRSGVLCCFRDDKEGILTQDDKESIRCLLSSVGKVTQIDTICSNNVLPESREDELNKIWEQFCSAQLVVTDRLHGMIFAAITNTPCIVFSNYNTKILGVYDWIKELGTVRYFQDTKELSGKLIEEMINIGTAKKEKWEIVDRSFEALKETLLEVARFNEN